MTVLLRSLSHAPFQCDGSAPANATCRQASPAYFLTSHCILCSHSCVNFCCFSSTRFYFLVSASASNSWALSFFFPFPEYSSPSRRRGLCRSLLLIPGTRHKRPFQGSVTVRNQITLYTRFHCDLRFLSITSPEMLNKIPDN